MPTHPSWASRTALSYDAGVILLAIDTCNSRGSASLVGDTGVIATVAHESGEPYSSWLFGEVGELVKSAVGDMSLIEAYGVASGPGSFTGLRVGLSAIKAWAELYSRPVIAVTRLEALAVQSRSDSAWTAAFLDAHRGQVFGALYRKEGEQLTAVGEEMVGSPEEFVACVVSQTKGGSVGWISPDAWLLADSRQGRSVVRLEIEPASIQLAPIVGEVAAKRLREGNVTDALHLDANYVRRSDAEILWKGPGHPWEPRLIPRGMQN